MFPNIKGSAKKNINFKGFPSVIFFKFYHHRFLTIISKFLDEVKTNYHFHFVKKYRKYMYFHIYYNYVIM